MCVAVAQGWRRGGEAHTACPPTLAARSPRMNPLITAILGAHPSPELSPPLATVHTAGRCKDNPGRASERKGIPDGLSKGTGVIWDLSTLEQRWHRLRNHILIMTGSPYTHMLLWRTSPCFACTVSQAWLRPRLADEETEAQRAQDCTASKR